MTEDAFLETLFARLPEPAAALVVPPGDDCAALRVGENSLLLIAVDQVVGGKHYHLDGEAAATPEQVGRKLLARNLSDIAAMGGAPRWCLTSAALGPSYDEAWLNAFFSGVLELAHEFGVELIGGDLASTPADNVASLTIVGQVSEDAVCRRRGARPGDLLYATGAFGAALETGHHLAFTPRCREGAWLAANGFAAAMIDVSDGLLLDAGRLCRASGVGLKLDTDAIPGRTPQTTLGQALSDGEDYELLAACSPAKSDALVRDWPFPETRLTLIGEFVDSADAGVVGPGGVDLDSNGRRGYDHFGGQGP